MAAKLHKAFEFFMFDEKTPDPEPPKRLFLFEWFLKINRALNVDIFGLFNLTIYLCFIVTSVFKTGGRIIFHKKRDFITLLQLEGPGQAKLDFSSFR